MITVPYTGYQVVEDDIQMAKFFNTQKYDGILENEYLIIADELYCYQNGFFRKVSYPVIESSWNTMRPRNMEQRAAMDMLLDPRSTVKLLTGTQGSGKTMLLVNAALAALDKGLFDKIVWIRNNVQVKNTDALGALPGTEYDKTLPYLMPMADHCAGIEGVTRLVDEGKLEVIPLGFLRGRSIRNSIILSSEAENLTKEHIQLLIGRVDEGSNLWLDADTRQRDRTVFEQSQGVETMIASLAGNPLFGYIHLVKSERSATARLADIVGAYPITPQTL